MTEPRLQQLKPAEWSAAQRRLAEALANGPRGGVHGPYEALIHSPELADRMRHLGDFVRFEGALPPRLKEMLIFAVARRWRASFMEAIHRAAAVRQGLSPALISALLRGERPAELTAAENAALDAAEELLAAASLSDQAFAAARRHFDDGAIVELITFVGYYTTLAMILNSAQVAPPPE